MIRIVSSGPRTTGKTYKAIKLCLELAEQGKNVFFIYKGVSTYYMNQLEKASHDRNSQLSLHKTDVFRKYTYGMGKITLVPSYADDIRHSLHARSIPNTEVVIDHDIYDNLTDNTKEILRKFEWEGDKDAT